jgi:hypothetical protein
MTRALIVSCLLLLFVAGAVWAEQIGGPSGPAKGELRIGVESNFRDHVEGDAIGFEFAGFPPVIVPSVQPARLSTHAFYGAVQYGICDRLSIRGKVGVGKVGVDATSDGIIPHDLLDWGYGLAWSAGLQYRICAPDEHGTSLALSGQFAHMEPEGFVAPTGMVFGDGELDEMTAALTVGFTKGKTRPYAGIVWSDFDMDFTISDMGFVFPWSFEKDENIGAVFGLDQEFCDRGWLNLEARVWDEASFAATVGMSW